MPASRSIVSMLCGGLAAAAICAAPAAAAPRHALDLRVTAIGGVPASAAPGGALALSYAVARTGAIRVVAPTTRFYLSVDRLRSRDDRRLAGAARGRIARVGRLRATASVLIPAATPTAGYYVLACVDDPSAIREGDERNNCRASARVVTIARAPGADAVAGRPAPVVAAPPASVPLVGAAARPTGPDRDGDGVPDAMDCAPDDPTIAPGLPDPLDPAFVDSNCDDHDGDIAGAVLVSATGSATLPCGSLATPCRQIDQAIAAASGLGRHAVYVAGGTYTRFTVAAGIDVIGGFGQDFQRDPAIATAPTTAVVSGGLDPVVGEWIAIRATGIAAPTTVSDLEVDGADVAAAGAAEAGKGSYAVHVARSTALTLTDLAIRAGHGAAGATGAAATDAAPAAAADMVGNDGAAAGTPAVCDAATTAPGGTAGANTLTPAAGGTGGAGGAADTACDQPDGSCLDAACTPTGGLAGGTGNLGALGGAAVAACAAGVNGRPGMNGSGGSGGTGGSTGGLAGDFWRSATGATGTLGADGTGGGGGSGSGGCDAVASAYGAGGGGGGAGGQGAQAPGAGGTGGGGSFGLVLLDSTVAMSAIQINGGTAGAGGGGGRAGSGQPGGAGGSGGPGAGGGAGGHGGAGGAGGPSGAGGGGAGGPSVMLLVRNAPFDTIAVQLGGLGTAGAGGGGGAAAGGAAATTAGRAGGPGQAFAKLPLL